VIAPTLYLINEKASHNLTQYVENGGRLVMSFFSGIVDENEHIRLGGYPASLKAMLGLVVEESSPYSEAETNRFKTTDGDSFACTTWSDVIHLQGAEALASFEQDYYAGEPAITRHAFGKGHSYYVGTQPDANGLDWLLKRICDEAGIETVAGSLPAGVEVLRRTNGESQWLFLLNHSNESVTVPLNGAERDLLKNESVNGNLTLAPNGVAIIEQ
jgi:beta-galactosidase